MRIAFAISASILSAGTLALAFPPYSIRALAYVGLVPFLLALRSGTLARSIGLGWIFGVVYGWSIATVFPGSLAEYYDRSFAFGVLSGTAIFTLMASVYYMAFAAIDRVLSKRSGLMAPFVTAAAWVCVEWARVSLFTGTNFFIGNPWGVLGYSHASGSLAQIAAWTGVYGISFAIMAVNAGLADWLGSRRDPRPSTRQRGLVVFIGAFPAVVLALLGAQVLRNAPDAGDADGLIEVAVVQGNVAIARRWRSEYYGRNLDVYLGLTEKAIQAGSPSVVVWPEAAMTFFVESEPLYSEVIARVVRDGDVELLAGGPGLPAQTRPPVYNSIFKFSPKGDISGRYDKEILMPFSEYFPFGSSGLMRRVLEGARIFTAGPADPAPIQTRMGRAGILVCNEAMLPGVAAARVRAGAEILVSPSNDAWINGMGFAEHMLAVVGMRAIEQRRYLVRASTSGASAVVDPWGRVAVRTAVRSRQIMLGGVRPEQGRTVYGRFGDVFALGCLLVVASVGIGLTFFGRHAPGILRARRIRTPHP